MDFTSVPEVLRDTLGRWWERADAQAVFRDAYVSLPERYRAELPRVAAGSEFIAAALIQDLKQRGMLDDTLVVWGGEFGRTINCQGNLSPENYGRDHHPRSFTVWLVGGGIKAGISYGGTDDYCYNITENAVHVHDLNATLLHCLGVDHTKLTYRYQGRDFRLTDVNGVVVRDILA
jgi:membrane-anchored protein YejM (alkaline phosphatase superfamily)